jgi:hypothetical protein
MHDMKPTLVFAIFAISTISADAAPTVKSKKADAAKVVQMVTITGVCTKLVHIGQSVDGCKKTLVNMNYSTGVSAYWFITERTILSFSGDGTRRVEQDPGTIIQAIDRIILAATDGTNDEAKESAAVGFCRFSDPTKKGAMLECMAHTEAGLSEGIFRADGHPPELNEFPVSIEE